jgi:hypothetical protein
MNGSMQAMDEMRTRERKLEDQRHNLELCLADAQQVSNFMKLHFGPKNYGPNFYHSITDTISSQNYS